MNTPGFLVFDGEMVSPDDIHLSPDNRSFRYGDGFFETIHMRNGAMPLFHWHMERFFDSLPRMGFTTPSYCSPQLLQQVIEKLVPRNGHATSARIRLTVFRDEQSFSLPHYIIQSSLLSPGYAERNTSGLQLAVYPQARKVCDGFSSLKHNSYLPYAMASLWAREQGLDDALVLNQDGGIADASIANIFTVRDGVISTPSLAEGCVNGVFRRYLIHSLQKEGVMVAEKKITVDDLLQADEVFLTNALYGIRWVGGFEGKQFRNEVAAKLHSQFAATLY